MKIHAERILPISQSRAWAIIDNFPEANLVNPAVDSVAQLTPDQATGLGAERECHFTDGGSVKERIVGYMEGREMTVQGFDLNLPLKSLVAHLKVVAEAPEKTRVEVNLDFVPKLGPLGFLMGQFVMKPKFSEAIRNLLAGIEYCARTGKSVDASFSRKQIASLI